MRLLLSSAHTISCELQRLQCVPIPNRRFAEMPFSPNAARARAHSHISRSLPFLCLSRFLHCRAQRSVSHANCTALVDYFVFICQCALPLLPHRCGSPNNFTRLSNAKLHTSRSNIGGLIVPLSLSSHRRRCICAANARPFFCLLSFPWHFFLLPAIPPSTLSDYRFRSVPLLRCPCPCPCPCPRLSRQPLFM